MLRYSFVYPGTRYQFYPLPRKAEGDAFDIQSTPERIEATRRVLPEGARDAFVEFRSLIGLTAKELLRYNACLFHGVGFIWRGRAFLLTGPSGVGKTTQFLHWQEQFPGEIEMICGDMPVLAEDENGALWVHPSPWNGKEHMSGKKAAPLSGVVLLEQGADNRIEALSAREAIHPFFQQFLVRPETETEIRALAGLMDRMLQNIPCFRFVNRGDAASTALLRETLAPLAEGESHDKL